MQESHSATHERSVLVVNKGIQDATCDMLARCRSVRQWGDVIVGNGCRNQARVSLVQDHLIASTANAYQASTRHAHRDDERIVLAQVAMERTQRLGDTDAEEWRIDNDVALLGRAVVEGAIVLCHVIVECLGSQGCVQLARLTVKSRTIVVEDAVSDIAGLLNLGKTDAATDGMYPTRWQVEDIARMNLVLGKDIDYGSVSHTLGILLRRNLLLEACIQIGTRLAVDDVPHLGLAHLAMLALCHLVIRMHLDAEVGMCVDELDEQRQLVAVLACHTPTQYLLRVTSDNVNEALALLAAISHDARRALDSAHCPQLSSPHQRVKVLVEYERM